MIFLGIWKQTEYKINKQNKEKAQKTMKVPKPLRITKRKLKFNYNKKKEDYQQYTKSNTCKDCNLLQKDLNNKLKLIKNSEKVTPMRFKKNSDVSIDKKYFDQENDIKFGY